MVSAENIQHRAEKILVMHLRIYMYVHTHTPLTGKESMKLKDKEAATWEGLEGGKERGEWYNCGLKRKL